MAISIKLLVWLEGEIKTPHFGRAARLEAGFLLRRLQLGEHLLLPHSRLMPAIGRRSHKLRIHDESATWRIIYRVDLDAIAIVDIFAKKTQRTPVGVIERCKAQLRIFDELGKGGSSSE